MAIVFNFLADQYRKSVFLASGSQIGGVSYCADVCAVILVPVEGLMTVVVPMDGSTYTKFADVPLEEIARIDIQEKSTVGETSNAGIQMDIHLAQGSRNKVHVNGRGCSLPLVILLFDRIHTANDLQGSIVGQQGFIERQHPSKVSYAPPQDISEKDSGISVGTDGYSTAAEYEDLVKVVVNAEALPMQTHPTKFRSSQIGRKASIQSPICASAEPDVSDMTNTRYDQQGSGKDQESLVQLASRGDLNDLMRSKEEEFGNQEHNIALSLSRFLGQILEEREGICKREFRSNVLGTIINHGRRGATKVCRRMRNRQGGQAKTLSSEEYSQELKSNIKSTNRSHIAAQESLTGSKAEVNHAHQKRDIRRRVSLSDSVDITINADHDVFEIPDSSKDPLKAQPRVEPKLKNAGYARYRIQKPTQSRKAKQHKSTERQVRGRHKKQADPTDRKKLDRRSNLMNLDDDDSRASTSAIEDRSDIIVLKAKLTPKGVPNLKSKQQRPTKKMIENRKTSTKQREAVQTVSSRPSTKRRAALRANMKIRSVALNETVPSQELPSQTVIPDWLNTLNSNSKLDSNDGSNMTFSSPEGMGGSHEIESEAQGSRERFGNQFFIQSISPKRCSSIEMEVPDQPFVTDANSTVGSPKYLTRTPKGSDGQHEYSAAEILVVPDGDSFQEHAITPEALDHRSIQTIHVSPPPASCANAGDSVGAGTEAAQDIRGKHLTVASGDDFNRSLEIMPQPHRPILEEVSYTNGDALEKSLETIPERYQSVSEQEANGRFEDAMTFFDIADSVLSPQPWQHLKQEEVSELAVIHSEKALLGIDYTIGGPKPAPTKRSSNERCCDSFADPIFRDPLPSKALGALSDDNDAAGVESNDRSIYSKDVKAIEYGRDTDSFKISSSRSEASKRDVSMSLKHQEYVSNLSIASRRRSTSPVIRNAPEAVMVSLDTTAKRDSEARAQVIAKAQAAIVIDISSNEEVDDDDDDSASNASKFRPWKQPGTPMSKAILNRKRGSEEAHCRTSKRLKSSKAITSLLKTAGKDLSEFAQLITPEDYALRKSTIISFGARGPRNQGVSSTQGATNHRSISTDDPYNAAEIRVSKKRKAPNKLQANLDHALILSRVKRPKTLNTCTLRDHVSATMSPLSSLSSLELKMLAIEPQDSLPISSTKPFHLQLQELELQELELQAQVQAQAPSSPLSQFQTPTHSPPFLGPLTLTAHISREASAGLSDSQEPNSPSPSAQQARARNQTAVPQHKTRRKTEMKINHQGSPVPEGHISCKTCCKNRTDEDLADLSCIVIDEFWYKRPSLRHKNARENLREFQSSSLGELVPNFGQRGPTNSDLSERSEGPDRGDLVPSSGLGKGLPSTPTAPPRALKDQTPFAILPDGRLVDTQTAELVQPEDPQDPFASEVDDWHLFGNKFCKKLRAGPRERVLLEKLKAARKQDRDEGSSTSGTPVTRAWRDGFQSHQQKVLKVLQEAADVSILYPLMNEADECSNSQTTL